MPNLAPERTPFQAAIGCGAFQRRWPTGALAKGMPLNTLTPVASEATPLTRPLSVLTGAVRAAWAIGAAASRAPARKAASNLALQGMSRASGLPGRFSRD